LVRLEALRGFAAFYVVLHHSLPHHFVLLGVDLGPLVRFGHEAVMLFFLISGFVINYSFRRSRDPSFRGYFVRRFARIYFPLPFVFALGYFSDSVKAGAPVDPNWLELVGNLLMLQNYEAWDQGQIVAPYMHDVPLWSLSYEWWFYMLFFPLATRVRDTRRRTRIVLTVAVAAAGCYIALPPNFVLRTLMYFGLWWCGVALADLVLDQREIRLGNLREPLLALAAIDLLLLADVLFHWNTLPPGLSKHPILEFRHFLFASIAVVGAVLWHRRSWIGFDVVFKPFLWMAPISYGMYISYMLLVFAFATFLEKGAYPLMRRHLF
jgi:peptidoglycan/LPS O-acetylase OafA/YrhL